MFFNKCSCGNKSITHTRTIPTMAGDVKVKYCNECWNKYQQAECERAELSRIQKEKEIVEHNKQREFEYLKREVELYELKLKAKEYGIDVCG